MVETQLAEMKKKVLTQAALAHTHTSLAMKVVVPSQAISIQIIAMHSAIPPLCSLQVV